MRSRWLLIGLTVALAACAPKQTTNPATSAAPAPAATQPAKAPEKPAASAPAAPQWTSLFDGKTLGNWQVTQFGTQGDVEVQDGAIVVKFGDGLSGVNYAKPETLPKINYEFQLQAKRIDGADFFCGLTFPYKDTAATLVCGGWGGALVGISSIDGNDAAHNETATTMGFDDNKWYTIRVRVTDDRMQAWIDKEEVVDLRINGRKISLRGDIELAAPLGLSTWNTSGAYKDMRIRKLSQAEIDAAK
jgi:hypothetical protein